MPQRPLRTIWPYLQSGQRPDSATFVAAAAAVVKNATKTAVSAINLLRIIVLLRTCRGGVSADTTSVRLSGHLKVKRKDVLTFKQG
jgi:hypothetical protein